MTKSGLAGIHEGMLPAGRSDQSSEILEGSQFGPPGATAPSVEGGEAKEPPTCLSRQADVDGVPTQALRLGFDEFEAKSGPAKHHDRPESVSTSAIAEETTIISQPIAEPDRLSGQGNSNEAMQVLDAVIRKGAGAAANEVPAADRLPNDTRAGLKDTPSSRPTVADGTPSEIEERCNPFGGSTASESFWLGTLLSQSITSKTPGSNLGNDVRNLIAVGPIWTAQIDRGQSSSPTSLVADNSTSIPSSLSLEREDPVFSEPELLPLLWPTAQAPSVHGYPATTGLQAITMQHVVATILSMRAHGSAGVIDVTLSPEEIGGVHLRLEVDPRDPDRMIVYLAFERPDTMELFRRNAELLSEAIRAAGYSEAKLDFGRSGDGDTGRGDQAPAARQASTSPIVPVSCDIGQATAVEAITPHRHHEMTFLDLRI